MKDKHKNFGNRFWKWLALVLPMKLVFFAALRVVGDGFTDSGQVVVKDNTLLQKLINFEEVAWGKMFRWRTDNLNDDLSSLWKHRRGWLWFYDRIVFSAEWNPGCRDFCHIYLQWGGGDSGQDLSFSVGFPIIGYYHFSLDNFLPEWAIDGEWIDSQIRPGKRFKMPISRKMGISIHDSTVWFSIWENPMEWSTHQPWWWSFNFNLANFFLGKSKYSDRPITSTRQFVKLPEGSYPVTVNIFESTWKRPRWPWPTKMTRANIDCGKLGIPTHAGKGENSWDMDDDYVYSFTCPEATAEKAVERLQDSILKDRDKYGNPAEVENFRSLTNG